MQIIKENFYDYDGYQLRCTTKNESFLHFIATYCIDYSKFLITFALHTHQKRLQT